MRRILITAFIIGFILFNAIHIQMGDHGASSIGQVYGIFLGGVLVFGGNMGICATTMFLRLLRKDKNKAW